MRTALRGSAIRVAPRGRLPINNPEGGQGIAQGASLDAPIGGWDAVSSLADMPPERAVTLDNWFPRPDSIEIRRGYQLHASGMGSAPVESILPYHGATSSASRLFAVTDGSIWDITASGIAPVTTQTGLANDRWQYVNFSTAGGHFLWICNGEDAPRHYDGSNWGLATVTMSGFTASDIISVNAHQHRLWFILKDSTQAVYLPVESIAGPAAKFEFGSLFTKGGYLNAMATWTRDGGAGMDDFAVFISSRGQAAVYSGIDPTDPSAWILHGVYDLGAPIGRRCFVKVGPELALINIDGVLPISVALETDPAAAKRIAMTRNINNAMVEASRSYATNFGWELCVFPRATMALLNVPIQENQLQHQYVMNTLTGSWCRFKNININTMAVYNDRLFMGGNSGLVYEGDSGAVDLDQEVDAIGQTAYSYYKSRGVLKNFSFARALVTTDSDVRPAIGMSTDYRDNATLGTPSTASIPSALYDSAVYDVDVFAVESRAVTDWSSIAAQGHAASIHFRARTGTNAVSFWNVSTWSNALWSSGATGDVVLRISAFDVIYKKGGFM